MTKYHGGKRLHLPGLTDQSGIFNELLFDPQHSTPAPSPIMNSPSHDSSGPKRKRQAAASDSADAANMAQSHLSVPQNLSREISRIGLGISTRLDPDSDAAQIQHP